jgi:hypothetical protein
VALADEHELSMFRRILEMRSKLEGIIELQTVKYQRQLALMLRDSKQKQQQHYADLRSASNDELAASTPGKFGNAKNAGFLPFKPVLEQTGSSNYLFNDGDDYAASGAGTPQGGTSPKNNAGASGHNTRNSSLLASALSRSGDYHAGGGAGAGASAGVMAFPELSEEEQLRELKKQQLPLGSNIYASNLKMISQNYTHSTK